jgi:hypothetical protein
MTIGRGTSSSKRLRYVHSSNTKKGRVDVESTLNKRGVRDFQAKARAKLQSKVACEFCQSILVIIAHPPTAMNEDERMAYNAARDIPEGDGYVTEDEPMDINDILYGTAELNSSHAGGEFQHIVEEELYQQSSYVFSYYVWALFHFIIRRRRTDPRTRQNRTVLRNEGFKRQFEGIVDAYMSWSNAIGDGGLDSPRPSVESELLQGIYKIRVMDVFGNDILVYLGPLHFSLAS